MRFSTAVAPKDKKETCGFTSFSHIISLTDINFQFIDTHAKISHLVASLPTTRQQVVFALSQVVNKFRSPLMKTLDWCVETLGLDYNSTGLCNNLFKPE